jgi:hypothetical protein
MFKPMFTLNNLKFKGEGAEIFTTNSAEKISNLIIAGFGLVFFGNFFLLFIL